MKLLPGPHKNGQLWRLMRMRRDLSLSQLLAESESSYRLNIKGENLVAVEDVSPPAAGIAVKSFWKNAFMFGIRRYRQDIPRELFFLNLIVTINGVNGAVSRQLNYLFSYISKSKPHGFNKQLKICTGLCRLLS
jgi:hypothetical protein